MRPGCPSSCRGCATEGTRARGCASSRTASGCRSGARLGARSSEVLHPATPGLEPMVRVAVLDDHQGVALEMADWRALGPGVDVQVFRDHLSDADRLADRLAPFHTIVAMRERTPFPARLMERLPALRLLVTTGMANASIDLAGATRLGVVVCGTRGLKSPTAELTWGLLLALARHIPQEDEATRHGHWQTTLGTGLEGKVLGVIGLGTLGSQVATIGRAFGMSVIAWSQHLTAEQAARFGATLTSKEGLLAHADFVTIHLK